MTGEHSGDIIGAWYAKKLLQQNPNLTITAIGGEQLKNAGATMYKSSAEFAITGIVEIVKHLPFIFKSLTQITEYICTNDFDTVICIDYPGFNLRLVKRLKSKKPDLKIIYVAPPQLWVWGAGRLTTLKNYCDKIVVMYPFEVLWYAERGVTVSYEGSPLFERLTPYLANNQEKEFMLALLPGSRTAEIKTLMPMFAEIIKKIIRTIPMVKIAIIRAESIARHELEASLTSYQIPLHAVSIIEPNDKYQTLTHCFAALTKPGTCTLELGILGIPSIVLYKTSWLTYWLARMVTNIKFMALPNLFLPKPVFRERIQSECKAKVIYQDVVELYEEFLHNKNAYDARCKKLEELKKQFSFTSP